MAWTGKIIGGVLGSLITPGLGTVIGAAIGHHFDKGTERVESTAQTIQVAFIGCLAKMARADGKITQEEINVVESIMARMGYTGTNREVAVQVFRRAKDDEHSAEDYLAQLSAVIHYNPQISMIFLNALHAVAQADGEIHPNEREILLQAERAFRLRPGTVDSMLGGAPRNQVAALEIAYKTLECTPEMSDEEIKKVWRKKCVEYHPDKLASKGLPEEFMQYAHEQLTKVNEAYDTIKKARSA